MDQTEIKHFIEAALLAALADGGIAAATCGQSELTCRVRKSRGSWVVVCQSPLASMLPTSQWPRSSTYQRSAPRSWNTSQSVLTTNSRPVAGMPTGTGGPSISIRRAASLEMTIRGGSLFSCSTVRGTAAATDWLKTRHRAMNITFLIGCMFSCRPGG